MYCSSGYGGGGGSGGAASSGTRHYRNDARYDQQSFANQLGEDTVKKSEEEENREQVQEETSPNQVKKCDPTDLTREEGKGETLLIPTVTVIAQTSKGKDTCLLGGFFIFFFSLSFLSSLFVIGGITCSLMS